MVPTVLAQALMIADVSLSALLGAKLYLLLESGVAYDAAQHQIAFTFCLSEVLPLHPS